APAVVFDADTGFREATETDATYRRAEVAGVLELRRSLGDVHRQSGPDGHAGGNVAARPGVVALARFQVQLRSPRRVAGDTDSAVGQVREDPAGVSVVGVTGGAVEVRRAHRVPLDFESSRRQPPEVRSASRP